MTDESTPPASAPPAPSSQPARPRPAPRTEPGRAKPLARRDRLIPASLIALSVVPVVAGALRLVELAGGGEVTAGNARFFADPVPAVLHIVSASVFSVLGAFQFSPGLRRRRPGLHRALGRPLVPLGLAAALSGLWLTQFYPPVEQDGRILYGMRLGVGSAMAACIGLAVLALRRRDYSAHGAWMTRGYALGLGAGTQVLTFALWFLLGGAQTEAGRALAMGGGWAINLVVAEWVIRRGASVRAARPRLAVGARRR